MFFEGETAPPFSCIRLHSDFQSYIPASFTVDSCDNCGLATIMYIIQLLGKWKFSGASEMSL